MYRKGTEGECGKEKEGEEDEGEELGEERRRKVGL